MDNHNEEKPQPLLTFANLMEKIKPLVSHFDADDDIDRDFKYRIKNPLVLAVCVSKYDGDTFDDLKGAVKDMALLKELWHDTFGFKIISNNSKCDAENKSNDEKEHYVSENDLQLKLTEAKFRLLSSQNSGENFDGFIFVFCGHGYINGIVTSDKKRIKTNILKKLLVPKKFDYLKINQKYLLLMHVEIYHVVCCHL